MNGTPLKTHCEGMFRYIPCMMKDSCIKYQEHLAAATNNQVIEQAHYVNPKLCVEDDFICFEDGEDD